MTQVWEEQALRAAIGERPAYTLTVEDILESLNDAFCALDKDLRLVAANAKALTLWKATDQVVGQTLVTAFPELSGSELERGLALTVTDGQNRCIEAIWPHNRTPLHVDIRASGPCVHVYFRDIARYRD